MSTAIDSVIILPHDASLGEVLPQVIGWLHENSARFEHETDVIFGDSGEHEREPILASTEQEALSSIAGWPGLGGTSWWVAGCAVFIFFHGSSDGLVGCVTLSTSERAYAARSEPDPVFERMTRDLHRRLSAKRTFSDSGLLSPSSWLGAAVEQARADRFEGTYALDLRG